MRKKLLSIIALALSLPSFAQFTTGTVTLTTGMTLKIDTDATLVTVTLTGPSNTWLGIGFGGTSMAPVTDMFIWNASASRDYTSSGQSTPLPDTSQSWTVVSDNVVSSSRTVVATRPLASSGDFTFSNNNSNIQIIYALSNSTIFSQHNGAKGGRTLTRSALGVEDFSLNSATVYPNPSGGNFMINSTSGVKKLNVYSQVGAFVKTFEFEGNLNQVEVSLKGLQSGVYLIELQNDSEKTWKKIIIE
jgi:hypothetical protein